ncbi:hypothetical protein I307_01741 [Cryptococcus deuterogattii 99/473]|uniref:Unplaced genomic scaffold supercont1.13, whole genome shotgun sequence n=2 Tax=Cryptococcus deuterogattii TaxID=1859096 RepID=A0A0D0UUY6_9TREE|nr:hypothetical protein I309_04322 [Cryptococcus deuterogattii LA55]KIR36623.1 hypothetical protein I352_01581 [Cryptococcus deuterogattii MMRL2647]KIR39026.1 hypothetical protein I313_05175 [Cryptococcus deuterogattii Ram5]KIR76052.1 hypothetical protein I310_00759 [Cryptococcus deuterogattii CA1014]KIR95996.1 hypothetical protein I304_00761 [Cryptococcus deuterogattii CBS 10090]KIS02492.1 hypothetical protein L804_00762 [Cryptococcus deuterogattii 2001/935-1]KIY58939.1 hypothetical protein 
MLSTSDIGPISQQYAAAATVPLIKSPSLWLPQPVELPNEIHPLPEDITAYFVYPFTLEEHVLSIHPSPHEAIALKRAKCAEILHRREEAEEQKERDNLKRIAPGYNPSSVLVPISASHTPTSSISQRLAPPVDANGGAQSVTSPRSSDTHTQAQAATDPMDDLVAKLEEMESKR